MPEFTVDGDELLEEEPLELFGRFIKVLPPDDEAGGILRNDELMADEEVG